MRMGGGLWVPGLNMDSALETVPGRINLDGGVAAGTSGRINVVALPEKLKYGHPYSKMAIMPSTTGSGMTHFWMGVCDLAGEVLAVTADDTAKADFANEAVPNVAVRNLLAPYTPEEDQRVYLFFCIRATSMPAIMRPSHGNINSGPPYMGMNTGNEAESLFTTPPLVGALLSTVFANPAPNTSARWYMAIG